MNYGFDDVYKFLMKCTVDDQNEEAGYDDYNGVCTEEITWTRETWIYNIDDVTYTIAWVEDFLEKDESFVEIAVYTDNFFAPDFYVRKDKAGTLTKIKNDKTLRAVDNYYFTKKLKGNLKNKASGGRKTKI